MIVSVNGHEKGRSLTGDDGKLHIAGVDPGTYDFVVVEKGSTLQGTCDAAHRERHVRHHVLSSSPAAWSQPLRPFTKTCGSELALPCVQTPEHLRSLPIATP